MRQYNVSSDNTTPCNDMHNINRALYNVNRWGIIVPVRSHLQLGVKGKATLSGTSIRISLSSPRLRIEAIACLLIWVPRAAAGHEISCPRQPPPSPSTQKPALLSAVPSPPFEHLITSVLAFSFSHEDFRHEREFLEWRDCALTALPLGHAP